MDTESSLPPWQAAQWAGLLELRSAGRLPHALLLAGPSGTGKLEFATRFAALMLCAAPGAAACGTCRHCRLVAAGSHPDLVVVQPAEAGKAIRIDAIRALRDFCAARPHQSGWRVILIEPAEALNHPAANALLKTLEEPGEHTLLLLVAHQPSHLPATVRSRCRLTRFPEPVFRVGLDWLRARLPDGEDPANLLREAGGRPLHALRLVESECAAQRGRLRELAAAVAAGALTPADAAPEAARLDWDLAVELLAILLRDLAGAQARDSRRPRLGALRCFDELVRARRERAANANLNAELVWDRLWQEWRRAAGG